MKMFQFYWLDGKMDEAKGETVDEALTSLGYGGGSIAALDYWKEIKE